MARVRYTLSEGEVLRRDVHHHWKVMVMPTIWTVLLLGLLVTAIVFVPGGDPTYFLLGLPCLGAIVWFGLWPMIVWRSANFVFTSERIIVREGVIRLEKQDIFLVQVFDVRMKQGLLDRLLGSGTLTVQFSDKKDPSVLKDIPNIHSVYDIVVHDLAERKEKVERIRDSVTDYLSRPGGGRATAKESDNKPTGGDATKKV